MGKKGIGRLLGAIALAGALGLLAAGCGGGDSDNGNGGEATKPAATTAPSSTQPPSNGGEASNTINLVAKNTLWDKTEFEAKAGKVTFKIDNQDDGVVHNLHVYKGTDNKGEDLGMTELEAGPGQQQLELDLTAGEHFLVCDAHPATMAATLEVE